MIKTYTVRIESDAAPRELDTEVRRAVQGLAESLDADGTRALTIDVFDGMGETMAAYRIDPAEFADDQS